MSGGGLTRNSWNILALHPAISVFRNAPVRIRLFTRYGNKRLFASPLSCKETGLGPTF